MAYNPVINPEYNATQLAEALAKLEGFAYAPSEVQWWQHDHFSERDFIYVTTQNLSAEHLQALSDEVGGDRSLLVCCAACSCCSLAQARFGSGDQVAECESMHLCAPNQLLSFN